MIILVFMTFCASFSGAYLFSSIKYNRLDNSFTSLCYSLPNLWVTDIESEPTHPFYDTEIVEKTTLDHFTSNLSGYVDSFDVGFYYFDAKSKEQKIDTKYVTGVRLSLKSNCILFNYNKANSFSINYL